MAYHALAFVFEGFLGPQVQMAFHSMAYKCSLVYYMFNWNDPPSYCTYTWRRTH